MTDVAADGVSSGKFPRARASLLCSIRFSEMIGLWKEFRFVTDGWASAGLKLRFTMKRQ